MIEHPGLSGLVLDKLGAMAGTIDLRTLLEQKCEIVANGSTSVTVEIGSKDICCTRHHQSVGAVGTLAARACRADEIEVAIVLDNHRGLDQSAGNLLGCAALLDGQSILGELHAIDVVERAPEQIVVAVVLDEEGVYAVFDANLAGEE